LSKKEKFICQALLPYIILTLQDLTGEGGLLRWEIYAYFHQGNFCFNSFWND